MNAALELPPPGPHILLGWLSARTGNTRVLAAWCPWCLSFHYHGLPPGTGSTAFRVAHCTVGPGLGAYTVSIVGLLHRADLRFIRFAWGGLLADRRRVLVRRGGHYPGRLVWPKPVPVRPRKRKRGRR